MFILFTEHSQLKLRSDAARQHRLAKMSVNYYTKLKGEQVKSLQTRKHCSRMRTLCLPTVRASVGIRCQYCGGGLYSEV